MGQNNFLIFFLTFLSVWAYISVSFTFTESVQRQSRWVAALGAQTCILYVNVSK